MSVKESSYDLEVFLKALKIPFSSTNVIKHVTTQFIIEDLGIVLSVLNTNDYVMINERVSFLFKEWKLLYFATAMNLNIKRYPIIFEFMRSGYMKWLREMYRNQYVQIIETDNLGRRIIEERLRIWDNKPMFRLFIQENVNALKNSFRRIISEDPGFFDHMPETFTGGLYV